jgi:predicted O-methyltransferase YrrM
MNTPSFTQDWFSRSIPSWSLILNKLSERTTHLRILEVGVFEGRSTCWLLQNHCKTPESSIVAIDSFQGGIEHQGMELGTLRKRFEANIATVESPAQVEIREGFSLPQLAKLIAEGYQRFDFISIDASHEAPDVLGDAVLGFELLKPGGVMAFDDYIFGRPCARERKIPSSSPRQRLMPSRRSSPKKSELFRTFHFTNSTSKRTLGDESYRIASEFFFGA